MKALVSPSRNLYITVLLPLKLLCLPIPCWVLQKCVHSPGTLREKRSFTCSQFSSWRFLGVPHPRVHREARQVLPSSFTLAPSNPTLPPLTLHMLSLLSQQARYDGVTMIKEHLKNKEQARKKKTKNKSTKTEEQGDDGSWLICWKQEEGRGQAQRAALSPSATDLPQLARLQTCLPLRDAGHSSGEVLRGLGCKAGATCDSGHLLGGGRRGQWRVSDRTRSHRLGNLALPDLVNGLRIRVPCSRNAGKQDTHGVLCNQSQPGALRQEGQVFLRNADCPEARVLPA